MPALLLPDTALPFQPRSSPNIVLNSKVDAWLTLTLKRINRIKRPLNSVPQHKRCLLETLSLPTSLWHLCTLFVLRSPSSHINAHENPLTDSFNRYTPLHIKAYVVHVDLVLSDEVAFKLTKDCIQELTEYHEHTFLPDQSDSLYDWNEKSTHVKKLHEKFVQAVNKFVFRTPAIALEGLEEDGAGELLGGTSQDVKTAIEALFCPLLPPPPPPPPQQRVQNWWQSPVPVLGSQHAVEPWKILPSSPVEDVQTTTAEEQRQSTLWALSMGEMVSSAPAYQLPLPSLVAQQCSVGSGFGGFGWDRSYDLATTM